MHRAKAKAGRAGSTVLRTGAMTLVGAFIGYLESNKTLPIGFFKNKEGAVMIPTKAAISLGAHLVAAFTSGNAHKAAALVGDTAAANYGYAAGKAHAIVAGDD